MSALDKARQRIREEPGAADSRLYARLIRALETDVGFHFGELYAVDYQTFSHAVELIKDWRIHRYVGDARFDADRSFERAQR